MSMNNFTLRNKRFCNYIGAGVLAVVLGGCSLNIPLEDQYSDPDAISEVSSARSLLASAYALYPHYQYEFSVLGPDFCPTSLVSKDMEQKNLYLWQDKTISDLAETVWLGYYRVIAECDVLLERLPNVAANNQEEIQKKQQIEAEAKTLKSLCYLNLMRIYAPAYQQNPDADGVVLKEVVGLEDKGRSSLVTCVNTLRAWLTQAERIENESSVNGWLTQEAVRYLLADLELYAGNYAEAARWAQMILDAVPQRVYPNGNYENIWKEASCEERIFAFNTRTAFYASIQYDKKEGDYFMLNPIVAFDEADKRGSLSVYPLVMSGKERLLFGKYNRMNKEEKNTRYVNTMRYAGACFIAAEAYARLEGQESQARLLMNQYMKQCGLQPLPETLSGDALLDVILHEKMKEFVGEGVAYFDCKRVQKTSMKRYNTWGDSEAAEIKVSDYRWTFPIPRSEYRYNEAVTQNEGWPRMK